MKTLLSEDFVKNVPFSWKYVPCVGQLYSQLQTKVKIILILIKVIKIKHCDTYVAFSPVTFNVIQTKCICLHLHLHQLSNKLLSNVVKNL